MTVQEERSPGRLGPYSLRERLGEGGMGVVYLAADPAGRLVAVKVLRRGVPGEATARRRLAREFETMRRVHSPFVAEVIDADVETDPPYIVTRYVPGRTVEEVVAQDGPMTGQALVRLARGLACALTAVHAAGVVHRDLKPANVMIVEGEPVVIDFGIAQAPDSTRLTMTGMFMGTPGYLAPEVIEGSPSGPAADVHSWAATVAFAATGRAPFGSGSFEAIFYRIVNGQPDLATMPAPLMPLVLHALARDPARRPAAADGGEREV
jgi:serine/threonine protein kinase